MKQLMKDVETVNDRPRTHEEKRAVDVDDVDGGAGGSAAVFGVDAVGAAAVQ